MSDLLFKKYLICSDSQCGHMGGLTPPAWRVSEERNEELIAKGHGDWRTIEQVAFDFFQENTQGQYDGLCLLGDLIDGKGYYSGARECLTADRDEQVDMAEACFKHIRAKEIAGCYGTCYHVGASERWESQVLGKLGGSIRNVIEIHIKDFDILMRFRHHIGRTSTPTGGDIMLRKMMLNELMWERDHDIRPADVYGFAHAHYFRCLKDATWTVFINPSLQTWTEFGSTRCSGVIHFGVVELTIWEDGKIDINPKLMKLNTITTNKPLEW